MLDWFVEQGAAKRSLKMIKKPKRKTGDTGYVNAQPVDGGYIKPAAIGRATSDAAIEAQVRFVLPHTGTLLNPDVVIKRLQYRGSTRYLQMYVCPRSSNDLFTQLSTSKKDAATAKSGSNQVFREEPNITEVDDDNDVSGIPKS